MSEAPNRRGRKVACPSCGAEVIIGGRTSQRVKCPKCTAEMQTDGAAPGASAASVPPKKEVEATHEEIAALREELQRLRERVTLLEKAISAAPVALPPEPPQADTLMVAGKLHWLHRAKEDPPLPSLSLPDPIHEKALVHNLRVLSGNQISIRSAAGDETARRLAERFKELFTEAEWHVDGVAELPLSQREKGLALAAGVLPPSRETTRTYLAFTAAGFALESRLDTSLQLDETMLIVA